MPLTHWNKLYLRIGALPRKSRNGTRIKWFAQLPFSAYLRVWIQERQFHKQLAAVVEGKGMHAKVGAGGGGQDRGKGKNLALPSKIQPSPLRKKIFLITLTASVASSEVEKFKEIVLLLPKF